jgi:hypothetical protein
MNKHMINTFTKPNIYTFNDITRQMVYDSKKKIKNKDSNGQLKLLFCELQFFSIININTLCSNNDFIHVLYIGSGRGYHIPILMSILCLNNIKWYFYDPTGHCKRLEESVNNVKIYNRKFLDKDIMFFKNFKNLIFISDIRSCSDTEPSIMELLNDYMIQNDILIKLQPRYSLIKFRYPFPPDLKKINFEKYRYPEGIMYLQCYNKGDSAELRIFIDNTTEISFKEFSMEDAKIFEERMFWYNHMYRINNENDALISGYILNNLYKLNIICKDAGYHDLHNDNVKLKTVIQNFILKIDEEKKYDGVKIKLKKY